jgi:ferrous iron transport protein B
MPAYRTPQARLVLRKGWTAGKRFLRDIGTTIVVVSAILWVLLSVPMPGAARPEGAPAIESSVAGTIGRALEPVTRPAGFDWKVNIGLIGSFGARELMVATMGVVYGVEDAADEPAPLAEKLKATYDTRTGLALLAFFVLACQCMSTVAAIRRETGSWRWPAFVLAYTYGLAYAAAVLVFQLGGLLGIR